MVPPTKIVNQLYNVKYELDILVLASSPQEALEVAAGKFDEEAEHMEASCMVVESEADLPEGWHLESVPYDKAGENDLTIKDILPPGVPTSGS